MKAGVYVYRTDCWTSSRLIDSFDNSEIARRVAVILNKIVRAKNSKYAFTWDWVRE